jgi:hypothetical protein
MLEIKELVQEVKTLSLIICMSEYNKALNEVARYLTPPIGFFKYGTLKYTPKL